jgi:hypothetical protein
MPRPHSIAEDGLLSEEGVLDFALPVIAGLTFPFHDTIPRMHRTPHPAPNQSVSMRLTSQEGEKETPRL